MFLAVQPRDATNLAIIIRCCLLPPTISTSKCFRGPLLISKNWTIASVEIFYGALLRGEGIYSLCESGRLVS